MFWTRRTGTKIKITVEYELEYDGTIDRHNVSSLVDFNDIIGDRENIKSIKSLSFKAIRS